MQNLGKPLLQPSEHSAHRHVGASLLQVVFNVMNTTFGSGFFLYPRQFATNGIITSLLLMAALLVAVVFSLHSLADAVARSPAHLTAYPETNGFLTRPCCSRLVSATINLYLVMAASAYIGLVADQVHSLLGDAAPARWIVLLGPLAFAAPFSLLRRFSSFAITSAFGIFVNSFVVVVLCSEAASILMRRGVAESMGGAQQDGPPSYADDSQSTAATSFFNLATLSTTVVFSFQCHSDAFIPALRSLADARQSTAVIYCSFAFCSLLYVAFSVLGALAWGSDAGPDPLSDNLPDGGLSQACRLCVILKVFVSFPQHTQSPAEHFAEKDTWRQCRRTTDRVPIDRVQCRAEHRVYSVCSVCQGGLRLYRYYNVSTASG